MPNPADIARALSKKQREALWTQFEESQDAMRAIQTQVLAQIDATFGPGMGEAVKEMIGG